LLHKGAGLLHKGAGLLHGGVVVVRTAYRQYRLSLTKAKLIIMLALTGMFGDVGAGHTYAILGNVFYELLIAVWALWRLVAYVDDMWILAPSFVAKPHPF